MGRDLREHLTVVEEHIRVQEQKLLTNPNRLLKVLPPLPPLHNECIGGFALLDWDHRLPSSTAILRVFGYHEEASLDLGKRIMAERRELIESRNHYPEFDSPDFDGIFCDETYEAAVDTEGPLTSCRLVSGWRRDVDAKASELAVRVVRSSPEFHKLRGSQTVREPSLGDLETVAWTPPCESNVENWAIDVWFLMAFDGHAGSGRSFLVDPQSERIVSSRNFSVNTR